MRRTLIWTAVLGSIAVGALAVTTATTAAARPDHHESLGAQVFEMRTYTTAPGRLGVLHTRFRDHTNYLFVKHGMRLIGYWTPIDKEGKKSEDTLVYILAYPSLEAREKSWKAFGSDEEWKRVWAESRKDGPVVVKVESQFLTPTDFSPIR